MAYVDLNTKWVEHRISALARARKEVIALNKERFENVKVSTLIAIQICTFGGFSIFTIQNEFSLRAQYNTNTLLPNAHPPLDRLAKCNRIIDCLYIYIYVCEPFIAGRVINTK